jgi:hypothetical protein
MNNSKFIIDALKSKDSISEADLLAVKKLVDKKLQDIDKIRNTEKYKEKELFEEKKRLVTERLEKLQSKIKKRSYEFSLQLDVKVHFQANQIDLYEFIASPEGWVDDVVVKINCEGKNRKDFKYGEEELSGYLSDIILDDEDFKYAVMPKLKVERDQLLQEIDLIKKEIMGDDAKKYEIDDLIDC